MPTRPQFKTTSLFGSIRSQIGPVVISLALVAAITAALQILTPIYDPVRVPSIYLIPVLVAATRWGRVPAIVAAFTGIGSAALMWKDSLIALLYYDNNATLVPGFQP